MLLLTYDERYKKKHAYIMIDNIRFTQRLSRINRNTIKIR